MTSQKHSVQYILKVEERTYAITPDKFDRSTRDRKVGNDQMPYPLTEEEATPTVPESERKPLAE
jgi:hypothetical protein